MGVTQVPSAARSACRHAEKKRETEPAIRATALSASGMHSVSITSEGVKPATKDGIIRDVGELVGALATP